MVNLLNTGKNQQKPRKKALYKGAMCCLTPLLLLASFGCVKNIQNTGYTLDERLFATIERGESTKADVYEKLGSPSSKSDYGQETWFYITSEFEQQAFFAPKLKKQTVIALKFNDAGVVDDMIKYNEDYARQVKYSKDTTPTEGYDIGVAEQLLGNIGRFDSKRDPLRHKGKTKP